MSNRKSNAEIVLSTLMRGREVEIEGYRYALAEDYTLCIIGQSFKEGLDGPYEERLLGVDMPVGAFIKMCEEKLTWDDVLLIGANNVLNDMASEKVEKRERYLKRNGVETE